MIRFMLLLLLSGMPLAASAGVYKWTDTNGHVFYGDMPPASVQAYFPELRVPSGVDILGCAPGGCVSPGRRQQGVKTYYYFPTNPDPWTTVVTLVGGRIANMDRQKRF
jgi:hypothetical protein